MNPKKSLVMKTKKIIIPLITILIAVSSYAANNIFILEKETYINDIPFSTNTIAVNSILDNDGICSFQLEDEEYIDDIPFNTKEIAAKCLNSRTEYDLKDEAYVDDIPFNTWQLFNEYHLDQITLNDEQNVNDIPFNTQLVTAKYFINSIEFALKDERYIDDIPDFELPGPVSMISMPDAGIKNLDCLVNNSFDIIVADYCKNELKNLEKLIKKSEDNKIKTSF